MWRQKRKSSGVKEITLFLLLLIKMSNLKTFYWNHTGPDPKK